MPVCNPLRLVRPRVLAWGLALGLFAPMLAGCGFEPLYGQPSGKSSVLQPLAEIEVQPIKERVGQQIRNRLLQQMRGAGPTPATKYQLIASTNLNRADYGVALDTAPSFSTVALVLRYSLLDASSGTVLTTNAAMAIVNFSSTTSPYATLVGDEDAKRRAAEQVADTVVNQLALFFQNRERGVETAPQDPPAVLERMFQNTPKQQY